MKGKSPSQGKRSYYSFGLAKHLRFLFSFVSVLLFFKNEHFQARKTLCNSIFFVLCLGHFCSTKMATWKNACTYKAWLTYSVVYAMTSVITFFLLLRNDFFIYIFLNCCLLQNIRTASATLFHSMALHTLHD